MIAFSLFFSNLTKEIEKNLLTEKFEEKKLEVAAMANHTDSFIDMDDDWAQQHDYYKQSLIFDMQILDTAYMTYAQVFDENLNALSVQKNYTGGFDPTIYPSFKTAIRETEMGDLIIRYKPDVGDERDVYVHYRWIPTGAQYNDRFLVVVAISRLTIINNTAGWYQVGSVTLIAITTILNIVMVTLIARMAKNKQTF